MDVYLILEITLVLQLFVFYELVTFKLLSTLVPRVVRRVILVS